MDENYYLSPIPLHEHNRMMSNTASSSEYLSYASSEFHMKKTSGRSKAVSQHQQHRTKNSSLKSKSQITEREAKDAIMRGLVTDTDDIDVSKLSGKDKASDLSIIVVLHVRIGTSTLSQQGRRFAAAVKPPCMIEDLPLYFLSLPCSPSSFLHRSDYLGYRKFQGRKDDTEWFVVNNDAGSRTHAFEFSVSPARDLQIHPRSLSILQRADSASLAEFHPAQSLAQRLFCQNLSNITGEWLVARGQQKQGQLLDIAREGQAHVRQRHQLPTAIDPVQNTLKTLVHLQSNARVEFNKQQLGRRRNILLIRLRSFADDDNNNNNNNISSSSIRR